MDLNTRAEKFRWVDLVTGANASGQVDLAAGAYKSRRLTRPSELRSRRVDLAAAAKIFRQVD